MKPTPVTVVLPDIRSALNIGAIFRTADAVGAEKVILCGYSATPDHPKVVKTAIGAEKTVPWSYCESVTETISGLKKDGYQIVALENTEESESLLSANFTFPVALIVGNEISGVSEEILALADSVVHLPMLGIKESLNVATATGITLYKILENYLLVSQKL